MGWRELQLVGLPRRALDGASARLFALGASGLQEDFLPGTAPPPRQPWDTGPPPPLPDRLLLRAWFEDPDEAGLAAALVDVSAELRWLEVPDEDWETAWRRAFGPIRISDRLTVAPPWDAPEGALVIEPGQGFGTGQHPTTVQALRAVEALAGACRTALDVGCGSGVLALAAARMGLDAHGVDVEEPAVRDARRNAERNGLDASFATTPVARLDGTWDLVLANLHAELVVALAPELVRLTGRHLVVAGILQDREAMVVQALAALQLTHRETDGPWVCRWYTP